MAGGASPQADKTSKISQPAFEAASSVLLALALIAATGRTYSRFYKSNQIAVHDVFYFFAVATLTIGTILALIGTPFTYLEEDIENGVRIPPADIYQLIVHNSKIQDASSAMLSATTFLIKFTFLFFFKPLLRHQKKLLIWWWSNVIILVPVAAFVIFSFLISCRYFDERIITVCSGPTGLARDDHVFKACGVLNAVTDAMLITIPIFLLHPVKIPIRRKLLLGGVLSLSILMILIAIIRIAAGNNSGGNIDAPWAVFWLQAEASVAVIVVSVSAFRVLFIAHQASKSPHPRTAPYNPSSMNKTNNSNTTHKSRGLLYFLRHPHLPLVRRDNISTPEPAYTGVRTHIGPSSSKMYSRRSNAELDMELPLRGKGIMVTRDLTSEKAYLPLGSGRKSSAEEFV